MCAARSRGGYTRQGLPSITPARRLAGAGALADRLLLAELSVAETRTRSGAQSKTGDGAARVLDEFDLIPEQCCHEAGFRLGREGLDLPTRAKMQDQQFAVDGDHGLASRCELVSPGVPGESLRSEAEPVPTHQVLCMLLILTDRLEKLGVRHQRLVRLEDNRPGKCLRVFEGHFEVHVSEVAAVKTFGGAEGFRVRVPDKIQPGSIIESSGGNHQRIPFPASNRITQPGWIHLLGKPAAIGEDGSGDIAVGNTLIDNYRQRRRLDDPGHTGKMVVRRRVGQAVRARTVRSKIEDVLLVQRLRPWLNFAGLEVRGNIPQIRAVPRRAPDARQLGLAIWCSRRGRRQIRFTVRSPGNTWGLVIEPLRRQR